MKRWLTSANHALRGLCFVFRHERNFRFQLFAGLLALALGFLLRISRLEFVMIVFLILAVLCLELINSAFEHFLDIITPRFDAHVERVKDVLAGAVLVVSVGAFAVGIIIFVPYFSAFMMK